MAWIRCCGGANKKVIGLPELLGSYTNTASKTSLKVGPINSAHELKMVYTPNNASWAYYYLEISIDNGSTWANAYTGHFAGGTVTQNVSISLTSYSSYEIMVRFRCVPDHQVGGVTYVTTAVIE